MVILFNTIRSFNKREIFFKANENSGQNGLIINENNLHDYIENIIY